MILGDAHAGGTRSTGIVGMNAWSNAIVDNVNIADDIAVRGRFLSSDSVEGRPYGDGP